PFAVSLPGSQACAETDGLRTAQGLGLAALWSVLVLGTAFVGLRSMAAAGVFPDLAPSHLHEWSAVSVSGSFLLAEAALVAALSQWTGRRDFGTGLGVGVAAAGILMPAFTVLAFGAARVTGWFSGASPLCHLDLNASEPPGAGWLGFNRLGLDTAALPSWLMVCECYLVAAAVLLALAYLGGRVRCRSPRLSVSKAPR
ncbi:MAG: hypothetical protein LC772_11320, partial [Chloroflexi bacterium]|nr:hypothetical protein [Chloroflexota bacterium]